MTIKLKSMPYAQAHVRTNDSETILISYQTAVAVISSDGWLTVNGLYSATTRRHLGAFAKEYCGTTYQVLKLIYDDDMEYNIHTGEIRPIAR